MAATLEISDLDLPGAGLGTRVVRVSLSDEVDTLALTLHVQRLENVALADEPRRYEATGNLCQNGQLADLLSHVVSQLNQHRPFTHLP